MLSFLFLILQSLYIIEHRFEICLFTDIKGFLHLFKKGFLFFTVCFAALHHLAEDFHHKLIAKIHRFIIQPALQVECFYFSVLSFAQLLFNGLDSVCRRRRHRPGHKQHVCLFKRQDRLFVPFQLFYISCTEAAPENDHIVIREPFSADIFLWYTLTV